MKSLLLLSFIPTAILMAQDAPQIVIAHRGASGYLPEHTLEAKAMAHAHGAHYIEQDLVLTKDEVPVVLHDIHIDTVTDVVEKFPTRKRDDGRYYALDFTLAELKTLQASIAEVQGEHPLILPSVDEQAVASVVADWTGSPVGRMVKNEVEAVLRLADTPTEPLSADLHPQRLARSGA